jgi:hypothetical protein
MGRVMLRHLGLCRELSQNNISVRVTMQEFFTYFVAFL